MAQNMYRVGDYVYFEISSAAPFQVHRIEELNKTATGNVEARVLCFYRRRDIPTALLKIADRAERVAEKKYVASENGLGEKAPSSREDSESPKPMQVDVEYEDDLKEISDGDKAMEGGYGLAGLPKGSDQLSSKDRHLLRQHELFLSRQIEALPATHIRGKCTVALLSEVETPDSYLGRDDAFFYSLVYDPIAVTLLADKGEIRDGDKYQCEVPEGMDPDATDGNKENGNVVKEVTSDGHPIISTTDREILVYHPRHNLTDRDIDQFLIVARAVGTFSRALDTSSSIKLPSLHMTAAAASRDVTLLHAMALLHQANYDIGQAVKYLVPPPSKQHYPLDADKTTSHNTVSLGGPILCRDQMEEWSAAEANLFEEAIEKYGKDFNDIRGDFLPWKSLRDIVEYYYMWKTTNRYVEVKKSKAVEQESKLKQVYIPNYNKPNPNLVGAPNPNGQPVKGTSPCESCQTEESSQWYSWGPAHLQLRLCSDCWIWWKKSGGLKRVHEYESYDLDGASSQDAQNPAHQTAIQKTIPTPTVTLASFNRCGPAPTNQGSRNGGIAGRPTGGQVIARLPLNHAQQVALQQKMGGLSPASTGPKTRVAFYLNTTLPMRIARRLAPKNLLNLRRSARRPFLSINGHAIKHYCTTRQPIEIIRAAKQIKGNKLSDVMLTQLAGSIISSGSQFVSQPSMSPTVVQKRPPSLVDKVSAPASKRQPSLHPTQQPSQATSHFPVISAAAESLRQNPATISSLGKAQQKSSLVHSNDSRPVAAVSPLSFPAAVQLANLRNLKIPPVLAQHPISSKASSTVLGGLMPYVNKDGLSAIKKAKTDSRWNCIDERLLFLAGRKFKILRKRMTQRSLARHIALHPCQINEFINKQLPSLQSLFS